MNPPQIISGDKAIPSFLNIPGEMAALTREFDWAKTPVGPIESWPVSLRTILGTMLRTRFPMLIFWGKDLISFYNDAFRPSLGNNGKHPLSLGQGAEACWAEIWPVVGPMITGIAAGAEAVWFEDQKLPIYREGEIDDAYWTFSYSPINGDDGKVAGVLLTCVETTKAVENLTQLKETNRRLTQTLNLNQALQEHVSFNEKRLLSLFDDAPVAIAMMDRDDLTFRMANSFYAELVGRTVKQIIDKPLLDALPELRGQGFEDLLHEVIRTQIPFVSNEVPAQLVRNGLLEWIYVDLRYQANGLVDEQGAEGVLVVAIDVTAQVRARKGVEESERRFRSLIEEAPIATCLFTGPEMVVSIANDIMLRYLGKDASIIGVPLGIGVPELVGQPFLDILASVYNTGVMYEDQGAAADFMIDGKLQSFYFDFTYKPLFDAAGKVYGIIDMSVDVTERVLARKKEEQSAISLRLAIELANLGTWSVDVKTGAVGYSDRMREWTGKDGSALDAKGSPVVHERDRSRIQAAIEKALEPGGSGRFDEIYSIVHRATGQERIIHSTGQARYATDGTITVLSGTAQDITAERSQQTELENQVRLRTEELAAAVEQLRGANHDLALTNEQLTTSNEQLAQFAYVASHDLQEPLRKIQLFCSRLLEEEQSGGERRKSLEKIERSAERMRSLIIDLLNFSKLLKSTEHRVIVDLNELVGQIGVDFELLIAEKKARVNVATLPLVPAVRLQLNQLFYNLLGNALKFTDPERLPVIDISSRILSADEVKERLPKPAPGSSYYQITVQDNGIGFDQKYANHIFEMFRRLHEKDKYPGTGIGLSLARTIAANHGGTVIADSVPGKGSAFHFIIPVE